MCSQKKQYLLINNQLYKVWDDKDSNIDGKSKWMMERNDIDRLSNGFWALIYQFILVF